MVYNEHLLLFLLPLLTAGLTTFYMFRMWFLTFTGKPRDEHVYEHAHESPWTMTVPLVLLAFFSVTVAWGWPIRRSGGELAGALLHHSQPTAVKGDFGGVETRSARPDQIIGNGKTADHTGPITRTERSLRQAHAALLAGTWLWAS